MNSNPVHTLQAEVIYMRQSRQVDLNSFDPVDRVVDPAVTPPVLLLLVLTAIQLARHLSHLATNHLNDQIQASSHLPPASRSSLMGPMVLCNVLIWSSAIWQVPGSVSRASSLAILCPSLQVSIFAAFFFSVRRLFVIWQDPGSQSLHP